MAVDCGVVKHKYGVKTRVGEVCQMTYRVDAAYGDVDLIMLVFYRGAVPSGAAHPFKFGRTGVNIVLGAV